MLLIFPTCHRKRGQERFAFDVLERRKNFQALKASQLLHSCFPHLLNEPGGGGEAKQQETLRQL